MTYVLQSSPIKSSKQGCDEVQIRIRQRSNIFGRFEIRRIVKIRFCRMRILGKVTFGT